ncbi:MAG TPA: FixH family protein [Terriglobales bacterium]|nr:FixH family protein [Terriglobales bacterium]
MPSPRRCLLAALLLAALLPALVAAAGCHAVPSAAAPWKLTLTTTPQDPAILSDTRFQLQVATAAGAPVEGATVTLDLVMATMDMGPNRVALGAQGGGRYAGAGHFTMAGDWNCRVTVTLGGRSQTQTFHYKVS